MNTHSDPELQEAFQALLEWFPVNGYRITPNQLMDLCPELTDSMARLDWISLRPSEGAGVFYVPSGELLETVKLRNPNHGALSAYPKGRWS